MQPDFTDHYKMNTVLILGAGASADYGLPIATQLKTQIVEGSYKECGEHTADRIQSFQEKFRDAAYSSIDQYIEKFPDSSSIGKYIMATQLYRRERENTNRLFVPPGTGWYEVLYERLNSGSTQLDEFADRLKIVTFNYDRSLETFLMRRHAGTHGLEVHDVADEIRRLAIVHIYGQLGDPIQYPFEEEHTPEEIGEVAENDVKVLSEDDEPISGFYNSRFLDASRAIDEANRNCFLGFGFSPENLSRLNTNWGMHDAKIVVGLHEGNRDNFKAHLVGELGFHDKRTEVVRNSNREIFNHLLSKP